MSLSFGVVGGEATVSHCDDCGSVTQICFSRPKFFCLYSLLLEDSRTIPPFPCFSCALKHLNGPRFWITSFTFLTVLRCLSCNVMWNNLRVHQEHSCISFLYRAANQWTKLRIDEIALAVGMKLLLWKHHSCAHLAWLGQWIFRKWSHLKDTWWLLHLSPGAQCGHSLKQRSFNIHHYSLETLEETRWSQLLNPRQCLSFSFSAFALSPAGVKHAANAQQSASSSNECDVMCRKHVVFCYHQVLQDSLNWWSIQGKLTMANQIFSSVDKECVIYNPKAQECLWK